jgi:hypothetical protein
MNHGDGIYGGMFVCGMYAAAFLESDPRKVVEAGLATLPPKSPYAQTIADVLAWHKQHPDDWKKTWQFIEEKWNKREPCPEGALKPFNIDAKLNGAYIALGLLYGGGDFWKTLEISTRAGQDSDCNPSNACGVLGVMIGYKKIPDEWKGGIPAIADKKFNYTDFSFRTIVESTYKRAIEMVHRHGGRLEGEKLLVKPQKPQAAKLVLWDDYGSPQERIPVSDSRWTFRGNWREEKTSRVSSEKSAEASIDFEGTGAILTGPYLPSGGKAEVYLDGKLHSTVDVYPDEDRPKGGESVWHSFGLKPGKHSVRLVALAEPYGDSKGSDIALIDLVVFR